MKHQLKIDYGDEVLAGLGLSPNEFAREARFLLAAKLYDMGRLSSGQAARLCELDRVDFLLGCPASASTSAICAWKMRDHNLRLYRAIEQGRVSEFVRYQISPKEFQ